jgi:phospholipid transport system substrate-binding protein
MHRSLCTLVASFSLIALLAAAPAAASGATGALDSFRAGHGKVVDLVAKKAATDAIQREVDKLLDYDALARESLGGPAHYADKCGTRCAEFESLLARLIRENYLRRLRSDGAHKVEYIGEETRSRGTFIKTLVSFTKDGQAQSVTVDYLMHETGGRWQVRDIVTDGVSLAKNYKFEFNQVIKQDGIDGLIARLESRLALLAQKK